MLQEQKVGTKAAASMRALMAAVQICRLGETGEQSQTAIQVVIYGLSCINTWHISSLRIRLHGKHLDLT